MIGQTLSHCRVTAALGAGAAFAADPERLSRLAREARVLASLNHSGIARSTSSPWSSSRAEDLAGPEAAPPALQARLS